MLTSLEDRDQLWAAIYAVIMAYERGNLDLEEAKVLLAMIVRGFPHG